MRKWRISLEIIPNLSHNLSLHQFPNQFEACFTTKSIFNSRNVSLGSTFLHAYFINIPSQLSAEISFMYRNIYQLSLKSNNQAPHHWSDDFQTIELREQKSTFIKFEIFKEFWQHEWLAWCFRFYAQQK